MSEPRRFYTIDELKSLVCDRMAELARELLPRGAREGAQRWREASTRDGGLGDSLFVYIAGEKVGGWMFQGEGHRDPIGLVAMVATGGDNAAAVRWVRKWLGIDAGRAPVPKPAAARAAEAAESAAAAAAKSRKARGLWLSGVAIEGTPAEAYLAARGIDLALLPRWPNALRFHPGLWHATTEQRHPAMLAAIIGGAGGEQIGTHCTWLERWPNGAWGKLARPDRQFRAKKVYGRHAGGVIPLARGESGQPWAKASGAVSLTEGIEDGLAVACALPLERVGAAVALGNLAALAGALPAAVETVVWWAQNDAAGSEAAKALGRQIDGVLAAGRAIELAPVPSGVKDVNDLLRQERAGA